ncbi:hypothetical protein M413DRAFT_25981 [Hebeloma cylindrosporum]|uniref:Uncharacterized protein n=1 Tax=Hebeloma cylindrosporum TaxID=76867 RepID=A0A0C2YRL4_HEBCY|nr:hypothetical protein M413DRAFT_25981 [Hebeloma cylindrosporum h7]
MSDDSHSAENEILSTYDAHCAICLTRLPQAGIQAVGLFDSSTRGLEQVRASIDMGLLPEYYDTSLSSDSNGLAQCPTCHMGYFTSNTIALSPSLPVLDYLCNYLKNTPVPDQMPLHKVCSQLRLATTMYDFALPDPTSILPYLELFTVVTLRPEDVIGCHLLTPHLPRLSIVKNDEFEFAPKGTSRMDQGVVRIFDAFKLAMADNPPPMSLGIIPLSGETPQCYWRLPVKIEVVLAALVHRVGMRVYKAEELRKTQHILGIFMQRRFTSQ